MNDETHVFIIWQNGRILETEIIADIAAKFELLQIFEVSWPKNQFHCNLAKFYGKSLPKGCKKEKECGCGEFLVVVAIDHAPEYQNSKNMNTVRLKYTYRQMYGGRNYIHCSDTKEEGRENLRFLTGLNTQELIHQYGKWKGQVIGLTQTYDKTLHGWSDKFWGALITFCRLFRQEA